MKEREIELLGKTNEEMGQEEVQRICRGIARFKRGLEMLYLLPEAKEQMQKEPQTYLAGCGLEDLDADELLMVMDRTRQKELQERMTTPAGLQKTSEALYRYQQFVGNKLYLRNQMREVYCVPSNERAKNWRARQIQRCNGALGGVNEAFIHDVMNFELTSGCSVGCPFCGVGARKLQKIYRYTPAHAEEFRQILQAARKILGEAAGRGTLYLASEALDNPDYEQFEAAFYQEFGVLPQITTAIPLRDAARTHALLQELYTKKSFIHRFSLRSLEEARNVLAEFTTDELLRVELLPQYPEAPGFVPFTIAGRELEKKLEAGEEIPEQPGSICCVDGFVVNLAEKSIRMITPCRADARHPDGVAGPETVYFKTAEDFALCLQNMIDTYMVNELPRTQPLGFYDYYERRKVQGKDALVSRHGGHTLQLAKLQGTGMIETVELLLEGKYIKREIARIVTEKTGAEPAQIYWYMNQLWKLGMIRDTVLFPE